MKYFKIVFLVLFMSLLACNSETQEHYYNSWKENLHQGEQYLEAHKIEEALPYLEKSFEALSNFNGSTKSDLFNTTLVLGSAYNEIGDSKNSNDYYIIALENLEPKDLKSKSEYSNLLYNIGLNHRSLGAFDKSLEVFQNRLKLLEEIESKKGVDYANTLNSMSTIYKRQELFSKAIYYNKESSQIIKNLFGENSSQYSKELSSLSQIYFAMGKCGKAIPIQNRVLSMFPEKVKDTSYNYALGIYTMSLLYSCTNEYRKEIELLQEFKQIMDRTPKYQKNKIHANNNLNMAYDNLGNYEKAIALISDVVKNTPKEDENYAVRLQNLAYSFARIGAFEKAIEIYTEALRYCNNTYGSKHAKYAQLLDAFGQLYLRKQEYQNAKIRFEEAISVYEGVEGFQETDPEYGFYLNNYARCLMGLHNYEEAEELLQRALEFSEKDSIIIKDRYYRKKHDLARVYLKTDRNFKALELLNDFKDEYSRELGLLHPDYAQLLKSTGKANIGVSEIDKGISYLDSSNIVFISQIDKVFNFRSEKENKDFMKTVIPEFYEFQSLAMSDKKLGQALNEMNLNNQLLLKNLLLSRSRQILDNILNSNDSSAINKVYEYKELKTKMNKIYNQNISDGAEKIDSLEQLINEKETDLVKYHNQTNNKEVSLIKDWKTTRTALKENEIAIEFSHFNYIENDTWTDSTYYVAYCYKKEWEQPKLIKLCEERKLINLLNKSTPNQVYKSRGAEIQSSIDLVNIYELVWEPLESELHNVGTIYFSPSGILNQIPMSAIAIKDGTRLIDQYNLVQLSSTSKITKRKSKVEPNDVIFVGGVEYNYKPKKQKRDSIYLNLKELESFDSSSSNLGSEISWPELPGTLKEISNIENLFKKNNKKSAQLKGNNASEENFKKLDGNSPKIIHIATHGFFYEDIEEDQMNDQNIENANLYTYAEDPLLRSGLILAGGNYAWKHGINPYENEDGILTALEISNLDLSNTKVVVLSACETGLGDIEGNEGVYGLQRAFKMAGVDIIIMSLWEVPDTETAEFMTIFYTNWLGGQDIRQAFRNTQLTMADTYKNNPEKWAAFVLFE